MAEDGIWTPLLGCRKKQDFNLPFHFLPKQRHLGEERRHISTIKYSTILNTEEATLKISAVPFFSPSTTLTSLSPSLLTVFYKIQFSMQNAQFKTTVKLSANNRKNIILTDLEKKHRMKWKSRWRSKLIPHSGFMVPMRSVGLIRPTKHPKQNCPYEFGYKSHQNYIVKHFDPLSLKGICFPFSLGLWKNIFLFLVFSLWRPGILFITLILRWYLYVQAFTTK